MRRAVFTAAAIAALGSEACREKGRPDPNVRMAVSHEVEDPSGGEDLGRGVPTRLFVPPEVVAAYSGIRVTWREKEGGKEGTLDVPLGGSTPLPGSSVSVRADAFLPAFTMEGDSITSTGVAPENPAARVAVIENGREIFAGWLFTRFPDVHPFTHERFTIRLEGGVRREDP